MPEQIETLIIGGGQAGLALSYYLLGAGHEHIILDAASAPGQAWRNDRWDSFTLLTPNWSLRLPGMPYDGREPDGFLARAGIPAWFERYINTFHMPVRHGTRVRRVRPAEGGYTVETENGNWLARNVVVAAGTYQRPKLPPAAAGLPAGLAQMHSGAYRSPAGLPPGAVLVVGSGQSACQIAQELYLSGRKVYMCVGSAPRLPRRYRGRDSFWWLNEAGFFDRTVEQLPSPRARLFSNPQLSGVDGGRDINLHQFARDGVTLLGRLLGADSGRLRLGADLHESLARTDKAEADLLKLIDGYIERKGLTAPAGFTAQPSEGYAAEPPAELDLVRAGITSVVWGTGYAFDYGFVELPVTDAEGLPVQKRGVTAYPGLYFLGTHWLYKAKSDLLLGVGEDAAYLAERIMEKRT